MKYLMLGLVVILIVALRTYYQGRRCAIDYLAVGYGLSRLKLRSLKGIQITALTSQLQVLTSRGATAEIERIVEAFNQDGPITGE